MKAFVYVLIVLALLLAGFCWNYFQLENRAETLLNAMGALEQSIQDRDAALSRSHMQAINELWKKDQNPLMIFSNHKELDDISHAIIKIEMRLDAGKFDDALEEVALAKQMITDIPLKEIPHFSNIF